MQKTAREKIKKRGERKRVLSQFSLSVAAQFKDVENGCIDTLAAIYKGQMYTVVTGPKKILILKESATMLPTPVTENLSHSKVRKLAILSVSAALSWFVLKNYFVAELRRPEGPPSGAP